MSRPKTNNALYFAHDADMRNNSKLRLIRNKFGFEGYSVWCFLLECLTDACDYTIPITDVQKELLAVDFNVPVSRLEEILSEFQRLEMITIADGKLYSESLCDRFRCVQEMRERRKKAGSKGGIATKEKQQNGSIGAALVQQNGSIGAALVQQNGSIGAALVQQNGSIGAALVQQNPAKEREGKEREENKEKDHTEKEYFEPYLPPTLQDVQEYIRIKKFDISAERFFSHYEEKDWMIGEERMYDWRKVLEAWQAKYLEARPRTRNKPPEGVTIGVGEWIDDDGNRRYGSSQVVIPMNADPRPNSNSFWNSESESWAMA